MVTFKINSRTIFTLSGIRWRLPFTALGSSTIVDYRPSQRRASHAVASDDCWPCWVCTTKPPIRSATSRSFHSCDSQSRTFPVRCTRTFCCFSVLCRCPCTGRWVIDSAGGMSRTTCWPQIVSDRMAPRTDPVRRRIYSCVPGRRPTRLLRKFPSICAGKCRALEIAEYAIVVCCSIVHTTAVAPVFHRRPHFPCRTMDRRHRARAALSLLCTESSLGSPEYRRLSSNSRHSWWYAFRWPPKQKNTTCWDRNNIFDWKTNYVLFVKHNDWQCTQLKYKQTSRMSNIGGKPVEWQTASECGELWANVVHSRLNLKKKLVWCNEFVLFSWLHGVSTTTTNRNRSSDKITTIDTPNIYFHVNIETRHVSLTKKNYCKFFHSKYALNAPIRKQMYQKYPYTHPIHKQQYTKRTRNFHFDVTHMNIFNHSVTDKRQHVKVVLTLVSLFLLLSHSKPDPQGQTVCIYCHRNSAVRNSQSFFFFNSF